VWHDSKKQTTLGDGDDTSLSPRQQLGTLLLGDVTIAAGVTAMAAPFLTIVDKAVVQKSSGKHTLMQSAAESAKGMLRNPAAYLRSPTYLWMWGTYAVTYATANSLRTITEYSEQQKQSLPVSSDTALFVGTTAVNSSASLLKDRAYAKLFGSGTATAVPYTSYALWMARDLSVIGSSFILPSHVACYLERHHNMDHKRAAEVAQFATPMAAQFVASPLHYLGLDIYNNNKLNGGIVSRIQQRWMSLRFALPQVIAARMLRILPGYSITGVLNTKLRTEYREKVRTAQYLLPWPTTLQQMLPV